VAKVVHTPEFRGGSGEPMVLLNGGINTWTSWKPQLPYLTDRYDVLAPTHVGNAGAAPLPTGTITVDAFTDAAEAAMDRAGIATAHLAGYSLGGWVAMELARRGRARSVYAFAPAGGWTSAASLQRVLRFFKAVHASSRISRHFVPLVAPFGVARRYLLRGTTEHGERMPADALVRLIHEIALSEVPEALVRRFSSSPLELYEDPGVPVTIAWPERDRLLPYEWYGKSWRDVAPFAEWKTTPGVGHMPTYDEPELIARAIIETAERSDAV
jgi:pimeloyl-ACP methyl ester carboxylesterase